MAKPVWLLALAPLGALTGAGAAGFAAGAVVFFLAGGSHSASGGEGWDVLGHAILGLLAGLLVGGVAYVVLLSLAARRLVPPGRRVGAVVVATFASPALLALVGALTGATPSNRFLTAGLLQLAWLAAAPALFVAFGRGLVERRPGPHGVGRHVVMPSAVALGGVAFLVVLAVVLGGLGVAVRASKDSKQFAQLPLVLFGRRGSPGYVDTPDVAGWRRDPLRTTYVTKASPVTGIGTPGTPEAYLKYFVPTGTSFVTMHASVDDLCTGQVVRGYVCTVVRQGSGGEGEIRRYVRQPGYRITGSITAERYLVRLEPGGGAVSVSLAEPGYRAPSSTGTVVDVPEADATRVLESAYRVGVDEFQRTAGTTLRTSG